MKAMVATPVKDRQLAKSFTQVVSHVLSSSSKFLHDVGIQPASKTSTILAKVQALQSQLKTKRQDKDRLRHEMDARKVVYTHVFDEIVCMIWLEFS